MPKSVEFDLEKKTFKGLFAIKGFKLFKIINPLFLNHFCNVIAFRGYFFK